MELGTKCRGPLGPTSWRGLAGLDDLGLGSICNIPSLTDVAAIVCYLGGFSKPYY